MGLLSSSKAKSYTTSNTQDVTTVDNRVGEAGSVFGGNVSLATQGTTGPISISSIDAGAVAAGRDLSLAALDLVRSASETSAAASSAQVSQAYQLAQAARQSETSGAINNFMKYGAIVAAVLAVAWALAKRKG